MTQMTLSEFRKNLNKTLDQCAAKHEAQRIVRRNGEDAVVLSASDWSAIEETLYLNQVPGMVESIHDAHREPLSEGTPLEKLDW
jgi:antitoxin YefM